MKEEEGLSTTILVVIAVIVTAVVILAIVGGSVYCYKRCHDKEAVRNTGIKEPKIAYIKETAAENHYESLFIK